MTVSTGGAVEVHDAGGHPHYVFPTSYDELLRITAGEDAAIGA